MSTSNEPLPSAADLAVSTGKPPERAAAWLSRLTEVEAHVSEHGRFPRARYGGKAEGYLYNWLKYQHQAPEPFRRILDTRVPGWDRRRRLSTSTFESWVQDLKVYRDAYGAWPSTRSRDKDTYRLAKWLTNQRFYVRSGEMAQTRKDLLDRNVPGWDETVQETWERTAREIADFRRFRGRMPSGVAAEHAERRLARWIDDMRRGRGLSPERKAFLDGVLPGWQVTRPKSGLKQYAGAAAIQ